MNEPTFTDNAGLHRYEALGDGALAAYAEYNLLGENDSIIMFTHTEVLPAHEGKGMGSRLARHVLDRARQDGRQVIPVCPFMAGYIRKHPEYIPLVRADARSAFRL